MSIKLCPAYKPISIQSDKFISKEKFESIIKRLPNLELIDGDNYQNISYVDYNDIFFYIDDVWFSIRMPKELQNDPNLRKIATIQLTEYLTDYINQ